MASGTVLAQREQLSHSRSHRLLLDPGLAGSGRRIVATPAGSRVAEKNDGSLFEYKKLVKTSHSYYDIGLESCSAYLCSICKMRL